MTSFNDRSGEGMNVLVTGGCGYIGSALVRQLQNDEDVARVTVLDSLDTGSPRNLLGSCVSDGLSFRRGDVRKYGDVESAVREVDRAIHLASITGATSTHDRREETYAVNLAGSRNVLNAAQKFGLDNVVIASSCNIYGRSTNTHLDEATEPDPLNPYAETKWKAERLLAEYVSDTGLEGTALRMSTNYGYAPGIRFNLVVNRFVFRALTDRPLSVYGDGSNWRPFIHVRDAARAYKYAACEPDAWPSLVYNVGSNSENYRISDIAAIVREELDADPAITYQADEHPGPSYHVDFGRLEETGFETEWTLREGVRELASHFTDDSRRVSA